MWHDFKILLINIKTAKAEAFKAIGNQDWTDQRITWPFQQVSDEARISEPRGEQACKGKDKAYSKTEPR